MKALNDAPEVIAAVSRRVAHFRRIWDCIADRFEVGKSPRLRPYQLRREVVVDHVCETLGLPHSWKTQRDVRQVIEQMGGQCVSPMNRRGFRGVRDKRKTINESRKETQELVSFPRW